jgi:DNA-binding CsgD family transcriptional regulator
MSTYGLTEREQCDQTRLAGFSTINIANHLVISVHTVQGHLRNIFTEAEVRTRRDLVTKIFFTLRATPPRQRAAHSCKSAIAWRAGRRHRLPSLTPSDRR